LNERVFSYPEPVDIISDMLALLGQDQIGSFFKIDADRGFNPTEVVGREAVGATAFESFNGLWASNRVLLGINNGLGIFKRNVVVISFTK